MRTASQPRLDDAATVVRRFSAAWHDHDLAAALALTSDDCVFEATSPAPDGQRHVGHAAIGIAWKPIFDDVMSRFTVEDSFTAGDLRATTWCSAGAMTGATATCAASTSSPSKTAR